MEHQGTHIVTSLSNSAFPDTMDRQNPELMSQSAMSSSAQGFARQQSSGFVPSVQPSSDYSMGNQSSDSMAPLIVSSSIRGTMGQQSSEFTHHSTTPSCSTQYRMPQQSSTELMAPSTSTSSDQSVVEGRECFYNREQAAVEYSRMHARYGNHLLSQLNFWKQAFTNLQAAYGQLQTDHTALLTRYELAISHNIDAGPIIMENMALKRRLASIEWGSQVQNGAIQPGQTEGFPNTNDATPIDDDSDCSDYSDYSCPDDSCREYTC
ncbi:hypothetical protein MPH_13374 [Macrophomina phaseolina MS6]|uniref:Uncharacterized protein n=1 Tax=Macrophomina phaseolina (strain MS6) TaxID=1126212 RepID=K2R9S3_MACPH|nr:hypothetical protein MPH_13374 [Macrophomina phaseolina MS6]